MIHGRVIARRKASAMSEHLGNRFSSRQNASTTRAHFRPPTRKTAAHSFNRELLLLGAITDEISGRCACDREGHYATGGRGPLEPSAFQSQWRLFGL